MKDAIWQIVRAAINASGIGLAVWGYISEENLQAIIKALVAIASIAWGLYVRYGTKAVPIAVVEARALPTVSALSGAIERPVLLTHDPISVGTRHENRL